jgi:hypothetical protein
MAAIGRVLDPRQLTLNLHSAGKTFSRLLPSGDRHRPRYFDSLVAPRLPPGSTVNLVGSMEPTCIHLLSSGSDSRTYAVSRHVRPEHPPSLDVLHPVSQMLADAVSRR